MIKLIDTRLVAKLMRETAKECGMTRVYSSTDDIWWAKVRELSESEKVWDFDTFDSHRRVVKAYDFIADNFIELLTERVKAEGFDLADNGITLSKCRAMYSDYDNADYRKSWREHWDYRDKVLEKLRKERNIKDVWECNTEGVEEGEEVQRMYSSTLHEANEIANKEMPIVGPPVLTAKIHGSTYVRLVASFIGSRQHKTYG
tara:strand:- start:82 stop:687 length:606 start_codon:yes stop_codon:yes gene_type:complete